MPSAFLGYGRGGVRGGGGAVDGLEGIDGCAQRVGGDVSGGDGLAGGAGGGAGGGIFAYFAGGGVGGQGGGADDGHLEDAGVDPGLQCFEGVAGARVVGKVVLKVGEDALGTGYGPDGEGFWSVLLTSSRRESSIWAIENLGLAFILSPRVMGFRFSFGVGVFHLASSGAGGLLAKQAGDDVEGHVYAGGDTGGGDDVAGVYVAGVVAHIHGGVASAEAVEAGPVGGCGTTIEEAAGGEEEGSGADGEGEGGGAVLGGDPVEEVGVGGFAAGAPAAGDEEDVERRVVGDGGVGLDQQAAPAADEAGFFGDGEDVEGFGGVVVGVGGGQAGDGEDLEGAGEVEDFDIVEEEDGDGLGGHRDCS